MSKALPIVRSTYFDVYIVKFSSHVFDCFVDRDLHRLRKVYMYTTIHLLYLLLFFK